MAQSSTRSAQYARGDVRDLLFKPDRPRAIDEYIDYFGGASEASSDEDDVRGEAFLERPA
jgi:hypothetical protein